MESPTLRSLIQRLENYQFGIESAQLLSGLTLRNHVRIIQSHRLSSIEYHDLY
jgi:hypothetical protein